MNSTIKKIVLISDGNIQRLSEIEKTAEKPVTEIAMIGTFINCSMINNSVNKVTCIIHLEDGRKLSLIQEKGQPLLLDF